MFSRFFSLASQQEDEDLSPEDAAMIKTIKTIQKEQVMERSTVLNISQDSLKHLGKIYYDKKFQGITWTSDIN